MQNNRQNTEMPVQKTDPMLTDSEEQLYTVMVDGEEMQLTLEQLIAAAEQGLSRANQSARADGMAGSQPGMTADGQSGDVYNRFLQAYPDVCPTDIPESVWEQANRTGDLLEAYRVFEIAQLRQELADMKLNQKNRERDVGSARSDGESRITDPIILALLGAFGENGLGCGCDNNSSVRDGFYRNDTVRGNDDRNPVKIFCKVIRIIYKK